MDLQDRFASSIYINVIKENMAVYKEIFMTTPREEVTDEHWKGSLSLFDALSESQKEILFSIIKQTAIDTVSNILGILDGSTPMQEFEDDLTLLYGTKAEKINDDLQSLFLEKAEDEV